MVAPIPTYLFMLNAGYFFKVPMCAPEQVPEKAGNFFHLMFYLVGTSVITIAIGTKVRK